jgi:hypothetical protein
MNGKQRTAVKGATGRVGRHVSGRARNRRTRGRRDLTLTANAADLYGVDVQELGALLPGPDATLAGPTFEDPLGEET